eukprot:gene17271-biopygen9849
MCSLTSATWNRPLGWARLCRCSNRQRSDVSGGQSWRTSTMPMVTRNSEPVQCKLPREVGIRDTHNEPCWLKITLGAGAKYVILQQND